MHEVRKRFGRQVCYLPACLRFDVVTGTSWRHGKIISSTFAKYKRICDAEECRKLAISVRSEAGGCSRYLEISFKEVNITQVTCLHRKKNL